MRLDCHPASLIESHPSHWTNYFEFLASWGGPLVNPVGSIAYLVLPFLETLNY